MRAPRKDLAGSSAQAKINWRRSRARSCSKSARERAKAQVDMFQQEVEGLRVFRTLVEEASHVVLVLSDDLRCEILYANAATARFFHVHIAAVLGR